MRILLSSNHPLGFSGYSTQAKGIMNVMLQLGHEVDVYGWTVSGQAPIKMGPVTFYSRRGEMKWGGDAGNLARHLGSDLLITLQDVWPLPEEFAISLPCPWLPLFSRRRPSRAATRGRCGTPGRIPPCTASLACA